MKDRRVVISRVLRGAAILIAILGFIDPSFRRSQRVRPEVSIVAAGHAATPALLQAVSNALGKTFNVVHAPFGAAAATVVVGDTPVVDATILSTPTFVVLPALHSPGSRIVGVRSPSSIALNTNGTVNVDIDVRPEAGDSLVVSLLDGDALVDRKIMRTGSASEARRITVPLKFVATDTGLTWLKARTQLTSGGRVRSEAGATSEADFAISVTAARSQILFLDGRPSWMSTFVRRTLERDPAMSVTSRVNTSRGIATFSGQPPSVNDAAALSAFDAIVVGAPASLSSREISGLELFLRQRGGSVLLLLDQRAPNTRGNAYERLVNASDWVGRTEGKAIDLSRTTISRGERVRDDLTGNVAIAAGARGDSVAPLRLSEWVAPRVLPPGATAMLEIQDNAGRSGAAPAVVWRASVGPGTVMVSGAIDAWKFRDSTSSLFSDFWRESVAALAATALPLVDLRVSPSVVAPGSRVELRAIMRQWLNAGSDSVTVALSAVLEDSHWSTPVQRSDSTYPTDGAAIRDSLRVWPTATRGIVNAEFNAPATPGRYRVLFEARRAENISASTQRGSSTNFERADIELVVADSVAEALTSNAAMMRMLAETHGGSAVDEADIASMSAIVTKSIGQSERVLPWYPMRSGWWIVPFAALLSLEWYIRRKHGLP